MATKKLTIVANAMAREVTVDETGKATGVAYIDKNTGRENHVQARIVVLAASACESARILLNSKSAKFPQGLGNSTGNVGKYLTDTTGLNVQGFIPKLMNGVPHNEDGVGGMHIFMPWWGDNKKLGLPARLPHRAGRRPRHAVVRVHGRRAQSRPRRGGARGDAVRGRGTARRSRTTTGGSTGRRSASPAAAR